MDSERVVRITGIVVGAILLVMGIGKFVDPASTATKFINWGWPAWLGPVTGVLEVAAGALLLYRPTVFFGALIAAGVMSGAIFTHLRVPEVGLLPLAVPLFVASLFVAWKLKPEGLVGARATG